MSMYSLQTTLCFAPNELSLCNDTAFIYANHWQALLNARCIKVPSTNPIKRRSNTVVHS